MIKDFLIFVYRIESRCWHWVFDRQVDRESFSYRHVVRVRLNLKSTDLQAWGGDII